MTTRIRPTDRRKQLDRLYAELPTIACQGKCQGACGVILMSRVEWERIIGRLGYAPKGDASCVCPMLDRKAGKCTVYDIRPLICRLWGLVREMACPFGCQPSRWLSEAESRRFLERAAEIGNPEGIH